MKLMTQTEAEALAGICGDSESLVLCQRSTIEPERFDASRRPFHMRDLEVFPPADEWMVGVRNDRTGQVIFRPLVVIEDTK